MSPDLEAALIAQYPLLFPKPISFAHDKGWHGLVSQALAKIDLIRRTTGATIQVNHVKEKFATLRIFFQCQFAQTMTADDQRMWMEIVGDVVSQATIESASTCEETGLYGTLHYNGGCFKTLNEKYAVGQSEFRPYRNDKEM